MVADTVMADSIVVFAGSLLVGGLAVHIATTLLGAGEEYGDAVLTALVGALVWSLLSSVPFAGPVVALVAWVAVVKWRYPVGWLRAALVAAGAWVAAAVLLAVLAALGVTSFSALGVPGV